MKSGNQSDNHGVTQTCGWVVDKWRDRRDVQKDFWFLDYKLDLIEMIENRKQTYLKGSLILYKYVGI